MDQRINLGHIEPGAIEALYRQFLDDPGQMEPGWRMFFEGFELARKEFPVSDDAQVSESGPADGIDGTVIRNEFRVIELIRAYRERGHLFTLTNPVRSRRKYYPTLDTENFGLQASDLSTPFQAGREIGIGQASLNDIVQHLKDTYCRSVGVEYMYIRSPEVVQWLQKRMEGIKNSPAFSGEKKIRILEKLNEAVGFEHFVRKRFPGQKRFSLEGCETLIPALDAMIETGVGLGIHEYVIGMAHRGRLNVLANILKKPYHKILSEFEGKEYAEESLLGDVKYHLGCTLETESGKGQPVKLHIAPNPSHLEAVDPVVNGIARAKSDKVYGRDTSRVAPVLIHGDASIAAQGVVYELLQMSQLPAYQTGGTIHLVINNQIGFTTNYLDARSSIYCTDVAKTIQAPIFHVNGDDVEAVVYTVELAMAFRQKFRRDVFIDLLCYRKYGHNESDEPRFTQPILYKTIEKHPDPATIYTRKLAEQNIMTQEEAAALRTSFDAMMEKELDKARQIAKGNIDPFLEGTWKDYQPALQPPPKDRTNTSVKLDTLRELGARISELPSDRQFFRKSVRLMQERMQMVSGQGPIDWAMGEALAYASLLKEGVPVRISGQDVERGTFSHRHAVLKVEASEEEYTPLNNLGGEQARFEIYNSPLSEYGVLGFEYGYAMGSPHALVIWEAQFGDFNNGAQIIIDQFLVSAEEKWKLRNGLVMYLPHGYEGQGPEHSSGRMERFLSLCAENNIQVAQCSNPANLFHLLRRQMKRPFRKPLVLFTPKSLLRHPQCTSSLQALSQGEFMEVIDDPVKNAEAIRRVVLCSGKLYYELVEERKQKGYDQTAIVRLEQLYPLPEEKLLGLKNKYTRAARWIWAQEEPANMGAWPYLQDKLPGLDLSVIARPASGSPASGSSKFHLLQQQKIVEKAFEECDCENVCRECKQLCISHLKDIV